LIAGCSGSARDRWRLWCAPATADDEHCFYLDTLAEYQWAPDASGLATSTLDQLVKSVIELSEYYELVPWQLTPRHVDLYLAGPGKRSPATIRRKMCMIDGYFAFLEQRYAGEVAKRFGTAIESGASASAWNRDGLPLRGSPRTPFHTAAMTLSQPVPAPESTSAHQAHRFSSAQAVMKESMNVSGLAAQRATQAPKSSPSPSSPVRATAPTSLTAQMLPR
jgi:hypothetical protein